MAKRTAVIDIGSNSLRLAVYEKTSRFAFHLIYESRSKARISEGTYLNDGYLQEIPMQRAFETLKEFSKIIKNLKCKKTLCIATSALRDAPNRSVFINRVKKELSISIKTIDGEKEAYFGAVAANNLIYKQKCAITVDIGGGSTEFALLRDGEILFTHSLKIGTIRIKELFLNKEDIKGAKKYIEEELSKIASNLPCDTVIGIGGSIRAISKILIPKNYPIYTLHSFEYETQKNLKKIKKLYQTSNPKELKKMGVKKDRLDTIREGALIFSTILEYLQIKKVITSGAGVREGVYLCDLLRNSNHKFPANFNPDVRNLRDKFAYFEKADNLTAKIARKVFDTLKSIHLLHSKYKELLTVSAKLSSIGIPINFFSNNKNAYYIILNSLNYGFSHKEKAIIALTVKYQGKKLLSKEDLEFYAPLFSDKDTLNSLSFMLSLSKCLTKTLQKEDFDIQLKDNKMQIISKNELYLTKECLQKLENPFDFEIEVKKV